MDVFRQQGSGGNWRGMACECWILFTKSVCVKYIYEKELGNKIAQFNPDKGTLKHISIHRQMLPIYCTYFSTSIYVFNKNILDANEITFLKDWNKRAIQPSKKQRGAAAPVVPYTLLPALQGARNGAGNQGLSIDGSNSHHFAGLTRRLPNSKPSRELGVAFVLQCRELGLLVQWSGGNGMMKRPVLCDIRVSKGPVFVERQLTYWLWLNLMIWMQHRPL